MATGRQFVELPRFQIFGCENTSLLFGDTHLADISWMICAHMRNKEVWLAVSAFPITLGNVVIVVGGAFPGQVFDTAFVLFPLKPVLCIIGPSNSC